jgi:hypothetical protein
MRILQTQLFSGRDGWKIRLYFYFQIVLGLRKALARLHPRFRQSTVQNHNDDRIFAR